MILMLIAAACIYALLMGTPFSLVIEALILGIVISVALETVVRLLSHPKR